MKSKEYDGLKLYPLSFYQIQLVLMIDNAIHKNACQIPTWIVVDRPLDPDLLLKAFNEEIKRNDCLRLHFVKTKEGRMQYFLPDAPVSEIPLWDYRSKTQEDLKSAIREDAAAPIRYLKGEIFRIRRIITPEGKSGLYFNVFHLNMDLCAVMIFYKDLLEVYDALEKGTELPKPPAPFEEGLQRDLILADDEHAAKHDAFMTEIYSELPKTFYSGIDRGRELAKMRKKKKDPAYRWGSMNLIRDKAFFVERHIDAETIEACNTYASGIGASLQTLLLTGIHIYLTAVNDPAESSMMRVMVNRRSKLKDVNSGGIRVNQLPLLQYLPLEMTFEDAIRQNSVNLTRMMKHSDFRVRDFYNDLTKKEGRGMLSKESSCLFTCLPAEYVKLPENWQIEFRYGEITRFPFYPYVLVVPDFAKGGMDMLMILQAHCLTEEDGDLFYKGLVKVLKTGIANPQKTLNEIMHEL